MDGATMTPQKMWRIQLYLLIGMLACFVGQVLIAVGRLLGWWS